MRFRTLIASLAAVAGLLSPLPAQAAPIVLVAGPLLSPGGFFQQGMHPVFTSCSFPTFDSPTATTTVQFVIRKSVHTGHVVVSNRCGTYDEVFGFTECARLPNTTWRCEHAQPGGFRAVVNYGIVDGVLHFDAYEHSADYSKYWLVTGRVLIGAE